MPSKLDFTVVHVSGCDDGYNPRDLEVSLEDVSKHLKMFL